MTSSDLKILSSVILTIINKMSDYYFRNYDFPFLSIYSSYSEPSDKDYQVLYQV